MTKKALTTDRYVRKIQAQRGALGSLLVASFLAIGACDNILPDEDESQSSEDDSDNSQSSSENSEDSKSDKDSSKESKSDDDDSEKSKSDSEKSESDESDAPDSSPEQDPSKDESPKDPEPAPHNEIQVVISVDWEGFSMEESNLAAMASFRADFPEIPLTQFLNAAYYTKAGANAERINRQIQRTLLDHDELGLHIHGWRSLFAASGVPFRTSPLFWPPITKDATQDVGHNVDIGSYSAEQLRKVIAYSVTTLEAQGYGRAKSFRSGGWMSRSPVIEALIAEGFERDSSAVATDHFLDDDWVTKDLYRWLSKELWGNIKFDSQPYIMHGSSGSILQIPDNGALADYVRGPEMVQVYQACKAYKEAHPDEYVTMNFGFHQETAQRFLPRLRDGIARMEAQAQKDSITLVYRTTETMKVTLAGESLKSLR